MYRNDVTAFRCLQNTVLYRNERISEQARVRDILNYIQPEIYGILDPLSLHIENITLVA